MEPYEAKIKAIQNDFLIPEFYIKSIRTQLKQLLEHTVLFHERRLKNNRHELKFIHSLEPDNEKLSCLGPTLNACEEFFSTANKVIEELEKAAPEITISHKKVLFAAKAESLRKEIGSIDEFFQESTTVIFNRITKLQKLAAIESKAVILPIWRTGTAIAKHFETVTNKVYALHTAIMKLMIQARTQLF